MNRLFLFIALISLYFQGFSYDFKLDGICYSILDNKTVEVDHNNIEEFVDYYTVVIPSTVTYDGISYTVVRLGDSAFKDFQRLNRLVLPYSIKEIGTQALAGCQNLESIELNRGLQKIGDRAFEDSSVKSISIPSSVTEIGEKAFCNLETIFVTFEGSSNTQSGNSNITIGNEAFMGSSVERVSLPNNLNAISKGCFKNCDNLKEVILKEGVKTIDEYAFSGCQSLVTITIPSPNIYINDDAFVGSNIQAIGFNFTESPVFSSVPFCKIDSISLISFPMVSAEIFNDWAGKLFDNKERITMESYIFDKAWIYPKIFTSWKYSDYLPMGLVTLPDTATMIMATKGSDITVTYHDLIGVAFDILINGESTNVEWLFADSNKKYDGFYSPTDSFMDGIKILLENINSDFTIKVVNGGAVSVDSISSDCIIYDSSANNIHAQDEYIYVYDISGRLIVKGYDSISTSSLNSGIYFIKTPRQSIKINIRN